MNVIRGEETAQKVVFAAYQGSPGHCSTASAGKPVINQRHAGIFFSHHQVSAAIRRGIDFDITLGLMGSRAKNHHYVARSYLARFVDDQGFLHVYDRTAKNLRKQRPKEVMKINSYYRQEWVPAGVDPNLLETSLGEWLEAEAKSAIDKLHLTPDGFKHQTLCLQAGQGAAHFVVGDFHQRFAAAFLVTAQHQGI